MLDDALRCERADTPAPAPLGEAGSAAPEAAQVRPDAESCSAGPVETGSPAPAPARPRLLVVDDEPGVLLAYGRVLRTRYDLQVATRGEQAVELVARQTDPFAVAVVDLRMPDMDGIEILRRIRRAAPETVRVLFSGYADMQAAMHAVNDGQVFRFLVKPCLPNVFVAAIEACVEQHRLIVAEREVLERTMLEAVKVMTEVLALGNPVAFSRASRLKSYVCHMAEVLHAPNAWQCKAAAVLSHLGCAGVSGELLERAFSRQPLSAAERALVANIAQVSAGLIAHVERLKPVAEMIARQRETVDPKMFAGGVLHVDPVVLGSQILKVATAFDDELAAGRTAQEAIRWLRRNPAEYPPPLVEALLGMPIAESTEIVEEITVAELSPLMVLDQPLVAATGLVLAPSGQPVTQALIHLARSYAATVGVIEPVRVRRRTLRHLHEH
jgi:response regulator RpfG family c-di-GMP phosphodiesterase